MLIGGVEVVKEFAGFGESISSSAENYVDAFGSGIIEYGLPVGIGAGILSMTYIASKGTYEYLTKDKK